MGWFCYRSVGGNCCLYWLRQEVIQLSAGTYLAFSFAKMYILKIKLPEKL